MKAHITQAWHRQELSDQEAPQLLTARWVAGVAGMPWKGLQPCKCVGWGGCNPDRPRR